MCVGICRRMYALLRRSCSIHSFSIFAVSKSTVEIASGGGNSWSLELHPSYLRSTRSEQEPVITIQV